jgi:hypothetical protein
MMHSLKWVCENVDLLILVAMWNLSVFTGHFIPLKAGYIKKYDISVETNLWALQDIQTQLIYINS